MCVMQTNKQNTNCVRVMSRNNIFKTDDDVDVTYEPKYLHINEEIER